MYVLTYHLNLLCVLLARNDIRTTHEEADAIMPQQMVAITDQGTTCIKVICDDTNVYVLPIYIYDLLKLTCSLQMEGTSSERTLVDIGATVKKHSKIVPQLLAARALSGCDTVAYRFGISKATVIKTLMKGKKLEKLGDPGADFGDIMFDATSFVATCHGSKITDNLSKTRYQSWLTKRANRKVTTSPKLKSLPPTPEAFVENVRRAHLQVCIWKSALAADPPDLDPTDFGCHKDETQKCLVPVTVHSRNSQNDQLWLQ